MMLSADDVRALTEHVDRLERRVSELEWDALTAKLCRALRDSLQGHTVRRRPGRRARTRRRH
jgi:hypothetical protein